MQECLRSHLGPRLIAETGIFNGVSRLDSEVCYGTKLEWKGKMQSAKMKPPNELVCCFQLCTLSAKWDINQRLRRARLFVESLPISWIYTSQFFGDLHWIFSEPLPVVIQKSCLQLYLTQPDIHRKPRCWGWFNFCAKTMDDWARLIQISNWYPT